MDTNKNEEKLEQNAMTVLEIKRDLMTIFYVAITVGNKHCVLFFCFLLNKWHEWKVAFE